MGANPTVVTDNKTLISFASEAVVRATKNKSLTATFSIKKHTPTLRGMFNMLKNSNKWKIVRATDDFLASSKGKKAKHLFPKLKAGDTLFLNTEIISTRLKSKDVVGGEEVTILRFNPNAVSAHFGSSTGMAIKIIS